MARDDTYELLVNMVVLAMVTVLVIVTVTMRTSRSGFQARKEHLTIAPYVHPRSDHAYRAPSHTMFTHHPYRYHYPYPQHKRRAPVMQRKDL